MLALGIKLVEYGFVPDFIIRIFIRLLCAKRIKEDHLPLAQYVQVLKKAPIADFTNSANEQHYELPAEFFDGCLGKRKKYSGCDWDSGITTLDQAEENSLAIVCRKAQISDGQEILELGCGWGSLTLWLAEKYPKSKITAVSNSKTQRMYIEQKLKLRKYENVKIITDDMNRFDIDQKFDRIVSIEMFEHMKNYEALFVKMEKWLKQEGLLFIHIFLHKTKHYFFETDGADNWLGKYFFTGGQMPSYELLESMSGPFILDSKDFINGLNYYKTSEAWLKNMDTNKHKIMTILNQHYSYRQAKIWFNRWRVFYMSVSELFGFNKGMEWGVGHFVFKLKR